MNSPQWIPNAAFGLSLLAILISLGSLTVSVKNYRRDRYALHFTGYLLSTLGDRPDNHTYEICVRATNLGRRPVSIVDIYFSTDPSKTTFPMVMPIHGHLAGDVVAIELRENDTKVFKSKPLPPKRMLELAPEIEIHIADSARNRYRIFIENPECD
jgi:hypothetical protein